MIQSSSPYDLITLADQGGWDVCEGLERGERAKRGQFFSPSETAVYLASCFTDKSFGNDVTLHDPGAGSGVLTAAFVESLLERLSENRIKQPQNVHLIACEKDENFIPILTQVLNRWAAQQFICKRG